MNPSLILFVRVEAREEAETWIELWRDTTINQHGALNIKVKPFTCICSKLIKSPKIRECRTEI